MPTPLDVRFCATWNAPSLLSPSARLPGLLSLVVHVPPPRLVGRIVTPLVRLCINPPPLQILNPKHVVRQSRPQERSNVVLACSVPITNTDPATSANQEPTISSWSLGLRATYTWRSSKQRGHVLLPTAQMCNCHCGDNTKNRNKKSETNIWPGHQSCPCNRSTPSQLSNNEHIAHSTFGSAHRILPS